MPGGLSGYQLAETLRTRYPDAKVLYMSGYTSSAMPQHGVLDTDIALLEKPFTSTSLAQKIREVLEGNSAQAGQET